VRVRGLIARGGQAFLIFVAAWWQQDQAAQVMTERLHEIGLTALGLRFGATDRFQQPLVEMTKIHFEVVEAARVTGLDRLLASPPPARQEIAPG
jgi:hypothetical protein